MQTENQNTTAGTLPVGQGAPAEPPRILSFEEIITAPDIQEETVSVPEWGGAVTIRGLSKAEQQDLRKASTVVTIVGGKEVESVDSYRLELLMLSHGLVEPKITKDQAESLKTKAAGPVDRVLSAIVKASGMDPEAVKKAEAAFRS